MASNISAPSTPTGSRIPWTVEEDALLTKAVQIHKGKNWKNVAASLNNRTRAQCAHRWQKVLNPEIKKGAWSQEEDELLQAALQKFGPGKWSRIAKLVAGRNGKQCRERWHNHLMPDVKKDPWSAEEDTLILNLRTELGNRWAAIARHLPGRTENAVKNRWNAKLALDFDGERNDSPVARRAVKELTSRKRTSSLLSVLSNSSASSTETVEPPSPSVHRFEKKAKVDLGAYFASMPSVVPMASPSNSAGLALQMINAAANLINGTNMNTNNLMTNLPSMKKAWQNQLEPSNNPAQFEMGTFKKTQDQPSVDATGDKHASSPKTNSVPSLSQLDWL
eukprot:CAMPEP_0203790696 /NCGR_PEP_ID=MMETSP0100_2-20121128/4195_1 /ASSEMBLY_ACC=CAM_ASM_000210 /TAXON_ID=96639 /ORGANISM=" , Strain NY0313808BC1" /LENGTH=334 /DNA_ID=CAMNT_0050693877 /DNA_START=32 /DNA_END=1034 /DNA_ORIENTATION=-